MNADVTPMNADQGSSGFVHPGLSAPGGLSQFLDMNPVYRRSSA
jgi:hypothetical protein